MLVWYLPVGAAPRIAVVIDDLGYRWHLDNEAIALPAAVALAVLPDAPHSTAVAQQGWRQGHEIILHLPMEGSDKKGQEPLTLSGDMDRAVFRSVLRQALAALPMAVGASNHMGSRLTRSERHMEWLMAELVQRQPAYYFVDSRTSAGTQAEATARRHGIPTLARRVFLDHDRTPTAILAAFQRLLTIARIDGQALAIGHPHPETIAMLRQQLVLLSATDVELVAPSALLSASSNLTVSAVQQPATPSLSLVGAPGRGPTSSDSTVTRETE